MYTCIEKYIYMCANIILFQVHVCKSIQCFESSMFNQGWNIIHIELDFNTYWTETRECDNNKHTLIVVFICRVCTNNT